MSPTEVWRGGFPCWQETVGAWTALFVGRRRKEPTRLERDETLAEVLGRNEVPVAWPHQVHSATVLGAEGPGRCGEGDAVWTTSASLAVAVVTADCVPVLLAAGEHVAAVHAGWRGIAADVVGATHHAGVPLAGATAWIGPAIGPCCYEVSEEVAEQVAGASTARAVVPAPGGAGERPHLDLQLAVAAQLTRRGVRDIRTLALCTRCHPERLWSYRREGPGSGGRNVAYLWRGPEAGGGSWSPGR